MNSLRLALFVGTATTSSVSLADSTLVSPLDPNLYFSGQNWHVSDGVAAAVNPGAYLKLRFTGSASVSLSLDVQPCNRDQCMTLAFSVDNKPTQLLPVPTNNASILSLSSGLDANSSHTLVVHLYNSVQYSNRWSDDNREALAVRGVVLDTGASTSPFPLLPKRMLLYGDSITEGVNAECAGSGDLNANAATKTWVQAVASALSAEYGQVGFGRQGWTLTGNGRVPPFFTPDDDTSSTWNKIYAGAARSFSDLDYIFVLHGTNDGLNIDKCPRSGVVASVQGWLQSVRAAAGPDTAVFLTVPFGAFGSANEPVGALREAFDAYQKTVADNRTYLIDLGREAAIGLECGGWEKGCVGAYGSKPGASVQSCDGIHPLGGTKDRARHAELGAMLAVRAALALAGVPPPPPPPTPPAPTPPACEQQCLNEGHCCSGSLSSYEHPSCAMGCTIARHTSSLIECQQKCHDVDGSCNWNIAGIDMNQCGDCPSGCDVSDGVQECLSGCSHGFASWLV